jgi:glutathione S-transferase
MRAMRLYYAAGTCSLAAHIALREAELPFTLVRFDIPSGKLEDGRRIEEVNDKGYVPVLELDDGERLTEVAAVLQYIGDRRPDKGLTPPVGSMARYRLIELLSFIGTEVHKVHWPLFHGGAEIENTKARDKLTTRYDWLEARMAPGKFALGDTFTVADAFLVTVLNWMKAAGLDPTRWPRAAEYRLRMRERPSVMSSLDAEGLLRRKT